MSTPENLSKHASTSQGLENALSDLSLQNTLGKASYNELLKHEVVSTPLGPSNKDDRSSSEFVDDPTSQTEAKNTLSTLSDEILLLIMMNLCPVSSVCLSLTARKFSRIHKVLHGIVRTWESNEEGTKLERLINTWMEERGYTFVLVILFAVDQPDDITCIARIPGFCNIPPFVLAEDINNEVYATEYTARAKEKALRALLFSRDEAGLIDARISQKGYNSSSDQSERDSLERTNFSE